MSRLLKLLSLTGLASVYLMNGGACDFSAQGASILPNLGLAGLGLGNLGL